MNLKNPNTGLGRSVLLLAFSLLPTLLVAQPMFQETTATAGLNHSGETWGAAWGDISGNGYPDLVVGNHRTPAGFYINNGNGTFTDATDTLDADGVWVAKPKQDSHGSSFADFDGDGDQDFYVTTSAGGGAGHLMVNEDNVLYDRADYHDLEADSNARSPVWVDYNNDGDLDMIFMNFNSARIFEHRSISGRIDYRRRFDTGMDCSGMDYAHLSDFTGDGRMEFICANGNFPVGVYDLATYPFDDITEISPTVTRTNDSAVADFDGDLDPDVLVLTGQKRPNGVGQVNDQTIEASIGVGPGVENGFTFETTGLVTFEVAVKDDFNVPGFFFIGSTGGHPSDVNFTLDPTDPSVVGIYPHDPDTQEGVFISYDPVQETWTLLLSSEENGSAGGYFLVSSTATISNAQIITEEVEDLPRKPELLINNVEPPYDGGTFFTKEGNARGFGDEILCVSVAAGDYDNDGDVDAYLVCRDGVQNLANKLYENTGGGNFIEVVADHGARGIQGFHLTDEAGLGESVITADYDGDGCLDLFVTNGLPMRPLRHDSGPDQIFRNTCNYGNHSVLFDLRGNWPAPGGANPNGVGATVYVTAGGVTQMREQGGGHHRWSQHHQRLHFGLGLTSTIDMVEVVWPNGQIDTFDGPIAADQIFLAQEGAIDLQVVELPPPPGLECGEPLIDPSSEPGLFLWRSCPDDTWHVQATAASPNLVIYNGSIAADEPFPSAPMPGSLETSDVLDSSDPMLTQFSLRVRNSGVDDFTFKAPASGSTCFDAGGPVFVGIGKQPAGPLVDLMTLESCSLPPELTIDDIEVNEGDGTATFTVSLSAAASTQVSVDYVTADDLATDPDDYTGVNDTLIIPPGDSSGEIVVAVVDDGLSEGNETFELVLSNPSNAVLVDDTGVATIEDNEASACGNPSIDRSEEAGIFLWNDCSTAIWHVRATAGGGPKIVYEGSVNAEQPFPEAPEEFSFEGNDSLDTSDPQSTLYSMAVANTGQDGFTFEAPASGEVCFELNPGSGQEIFIGTGKFAAGSSLSLVDLGACSLP